MLWGLTMNQIDKIRVLDSNESDFDDKFRQISASEMAVNDSVDSIVDEIIRAVRDDGDDALLNYTNRFDGRNCRKVSDLLVSYDNLEKAKMKVDQNVFEALKLAAKRIQAYHQRQVQESWQYREEDGNLLGQKITAIERVGVYVPGGKASYPSSVLMNVIPARIAGVDEIVMVVPAPNGEINPSVLAAAELVGVDEVWTIGGAQAVAGLAYGTQSLRRVDKIVGPGNIYVASAKRKVFGKVGLDMVAGPSEIMIICDGGTNPDWIAMDLFSQAEHDENAQAVLLSWDEAFINQVHASIKKLLPDMERKEIIEKSFFNRGALIKVRDSDEAVELCNQMAPEHLELSVSEPEALLLQIRHAGSIFLGRHSAEALGDYCAGPNHVLPTSATARFSSPLGVYDFQKRSSVISCTSKGATFLGRVASTLARSESLEAHARSAEYRIEDKCY